MAKLTDLEVCHVNIYPGVLTFSRNLKDKEDIRILLNHSQSTKPRNMTIITEVGLFLKPFVHKQYTVPHDAVSH